MKPSPKVQAGDHMVMTLRFARPVVHLYTGELVLEMLERLLFTRVASIRLPMRYACA